MTHLDTAPVSGRLNPASTQLPYTRYYRHHRTPSSSQHQVFKPSASLRSPAIKRHATLNDGWTGTGSDQVNALKHSKVPRMQVTSIQQYLLRDMGEARTRTQTRTRAQTQSRTQTQTDTFTHVQPWPETAQAQTQNTHQESTQTWT